MDDWSKKKMNIYNLRYLISAFICSPICAPILRLPFAMRASVLLMFRSCFIYSSHQIEGEFVLLHILNKSIFTLHPPSHASHRYNLYTSIFPIHPLPFIANILGFARWLDSWKLGWPRRRKIVQTYVKIVALKRAINIDTAKNAL